MTARTQNRSAAHQPVVFAGGRRERERIDVTVYVYDGMGQLAAEYGGTVPATARAYLTADHLGSTRVVTNHDGTEILRRLDYLPFGEEVPVPGGSWLSGVSGYATPTASTNILFTGQLRDGETGLNYFGARYFSGAQGRWTSADQINVTNARLLSPSSTLNKYAYAANNPLKYTDPDGRDITVFYWPGAPTGHITMAAYNQDTRDFAYLSVGPQKHLDPAALLYPWAGVPGTSGYLLPQSVDELRQNYASLTIQTSPEVAQQAIDAIRNGAGTGNWALIGNNCTSSVANVLREIGLSPGGPGMIAWQPRVLWANLFSQYAGNSSRQYERSSRYGEDFNRLVIKNEPGKDYGDSRYGMNTFDWLMLMFQAPLKACVTVTDSASGTTSRDCQ